MSSVVHDFLVGETVYIFSERLNEIISGKIEGFEGIQRSRVKILQSTPGGLIRHIVSWVNVFRDREDAVRISQEYELYQRDRKNIYPKGSHDVVYVKGMTVHLKQSGEFVSDSEGNPYVYQIIKVFRNSQKVSLVNSYGESVGTFSYSDIEFCSYEPLFKSTDYQLGQVVSWLEGDDSYEGVITNLKDNVAEVSNIKKLYPWDYKKFLPYYKLNGDDPFVASDNMILTSIVGDDIDQE